MAQVLNAQVPIYTLFSISKQLVVLENAEYNPKVFLMLSYVRAVHQDIIKEHQYKVSQEWLKDLVHQRLEGGESTRRA